MVIQVYTEEKIMMIKKLVAHGNSAALVIDKPILEILKVTMDTPLEITTDGRNLIISPADTPQREKNLKKHYRR
jgi:antitoxin component of MazEF toxin-antitoxin module